MEKANEHNNPRMKQSLALIENKGDLMCQVISKANGNVHKSVKKLLDARVDPNYRTESENKVPVLAIACKKDKCVNLLLKAGTDPNSYVEYKGNRREYCIDIDKNFTLIEAGAKPHFSKKDLSEAFTWAKKNNKEKIMDKLVTTPLFINTNEGGFLGPGSVIERAIKVYEKDLK